MKLALFFCFALQGLIAQDKPSTYQTQDMPNENVRDIHLEVEVSKEIILSSSLNVQKPALMSELQKVTGVQDVFLHKKVVTIVKRPGINWDKLMTEIVQTIQKVLKVQLRALPALPPITKSAAQDIPF